MLSDVKLPNQPEFEIGIWGNRRKQYLKQYHRIIYYNMLTLCTLYPHLTDIEKRAQRMFDELMDEIAKQEGITEQLKAKDMMKWVGLMNNIRSCAKEVVMKDLIYA